MAVIKIHSLKFQSKLKDRGFIVMFLGYAEDHSTDIYRFLKMGTKTVVLGRNVIWLNKLYCHYINLCKTKNIQSFSFAKEEVNDTFDKTK